MTELASLTFAVLPDILPVCSLTVKAVPFLNLDRDTDASSV